MKTIWLFLALAIPMEAWSLTTCSPASCSPECDSSCGYQTCSQNNSMSFTITQIPFGYPTPGGACSDSMDGAVINQLPFSVDGVSHNSIQRTISHPYITCENQIAYGDPCPPPPDPDPPIPPPLPPL